jgi:endonuclease G
VLLKIKIPSRYWKVIVVETNDGVASYGFVLEQDLSDVEFEEFLVPENFEPFMVPLAEIQEMAGVTFPDVVLDADQFNSNEGIDLAFRAGMKRRTEAEGVVMEGLIV